MLAGEPGIPGVTVDLLNPQGVIIATTTTDASGNYTFTVPPGSYLVQVSDTHNVLDDFTDAPLGPSQGADNNNQAQPYTITIASGSNTTADFGYVQNQTPAGVIGNQVWFETDHDGIYEPLNGEIGVAGVVVRLTPPAGVNLGLGAGVAITTTTGADGGYAFTSLPIGVFTVYTVTVTDQFGILTGYQVTALGTPGADYNNQQQPYQVPLPPASSINMTADFGYYKPADFTVVKQLNTKGDVRIGDTVTFTIRITNTGGGTITVLPLTDVFTPTYLGYVGAYPTPNLVASGVFTWTDLTGSPNGFGTDLGPNLSFSVIVTFTAKADTHQLPNAQTLNEGIVKGAKADPDGPYGPLPEQPLPEKKGVAGVTITKPTGLEIASIAGRQDGRSAWLMWETANEANIGGYNVLRQAPDGQFIAVNSELIFAEHAGAAGGASYEFRDNDLAPGTYTYILELVRLNGTKERMAPVSVTIAP